MLHLIQYNLSGLAQAARDSVKPVRSPKSAVRCQVLRTKLFPLVAEDDSLFCSSKSQIEEHINHDRKTTTTRRGNRKATIPVDYSVSSIKCGVETATTRDRLKAARAIRGSRLF